MIEECVCKEYLGRITVFTIPCDKNTSSAFINPSRPATMITSEDSIEQIKLSARFLDKRNGQQISINLSTSMIIPPPPTRR